MNHYIDCQAVNGSCCSTLLFAFLSQNVWIILWAVILDCYSNLKGRCFQWLMPSIWELYMASCPCRGHFIWAVILIFFITEKIINGMAHYNLGQTHQGCTFPDHVILEAFLMVLQIKFGIPDHLFDLGPAVCSMDIPLACSKGTP